MANDAEISAAPHKGPWRVAGWTIAALALLAPLAAMQFTPDVNWTVGDFIFAGLLIGLVGIAFELTVRASSNYAFRGGVAAALAAAFLIVWANGAVGMIGNEDNPYNLLFLGVICVALIGAVAARFRAGGLAVAMLVAGFAHVAIAAGGISSDLRGATISAALGSLWLISAGLFRLGRG